MPTQTLETLLVLLLTILFLSLLVELAHIGEHPAPSKASRRSPRPLRPRTPKDCAWCRTAAGAPAPAVAQAPIPYPQLKSSRGPLREKSVKTAGYGCPNPDCRYFNNPDPAVHALVDYGHTCTCAARKRSASVTASMIRSRTSSARLATGNSQRGATHPWTGSRRQPPAPLRSCTPSLKVSAHTLRPAAFSCLKPPSEVGSPAPASTHRACITGSCAT